MRWAGPPLLALFVNALTAMIRPDYMPMVVALTGVALVGIYVVPVGDHVLGIQGSSRGLIPLQLLGEGIDTEVAPGVGTWYHLLVRNPNTDEIVQRAYVAHRDPRGHTVLPRNWGFTWSTKVTGFVTKELDIPADDDAPLDLFLVPFETPTTIAFVVRSSANDAKLDVAKYVELGSAILFLEMRARATRVPPSRCHVTIIARDGRLDVTAHKGWPDVN